MEKKRFYNIDFLRFIFAAFIVLYHLTGSALHNIRDIAVFSELRHCFRMGGHCVEFFFIISGFFFFLYLNEKQCVWNFIKKKFLRLWPLLAFMLFLFFILSLFDLVKFYKYDNLLSISLLNGTGLQFGKIHRGYGNVHPSWYISTLFWTLLFYFSLFKNCDKKKVLILIATIIFLSLRAVNTNNAILKEIIFSGFLRGFSCVGIGVFSAIFYQKIKKNADNWHPNIIQKIVLTLLEFGALWWIGSLFLFNNIRTQNITIIILLFLILYFLFLIKKGYISILLENRFSHYLGSLSYSLYITHALIVELCQNFLFKKTNIFTLSHPYFVFFGAFLCAIIFGIIVHHSIECPINNYIKNKNTKEYLNA